MGRHGTPESDVSAGPATSGSWGGDSWEAAIAPGVEDSLYASGDGYQPVNDWSGVYSVQPETTAPAPYGEYYDYESYAPPQEQPQPVYEQPMDQSYYESVYASYPSYTQQVIPEPVQESSPMWDGPAWQDPYAAPAAPATFYGDPLTDPYPAVQAYEAPAYEAPSAAAPAYAPQDYASPAYAQPLPPQQQPYEAHNFHHPEFDTGQFEAVYAAPDATDAEYDLLPENEGPFDAYDGEGYEAGYAADEYELDDDAYEAAAVVYEDDAYEVDPDDAPIRSRSRSGGNGGGPGKFGSGGGGGAYRLRTPGGRRTLSAITSAPAAVVGVAAVAVAAVGGLRLPAGHAEAAQPDPTTPSSGLEQNLLQMRAASANLADRATRSEQRSELSQQQALERQRLAEMAPKFFLPVNTNDYALTAGFGDAGARWASLHTGQDFAVATGTKVVAVTDGVVTDAGWAGAFGYRIVVTHPDGSQTWYCHLSVMKVKSGPVKAGQLIALSGDTGNSTGPHLHFEYHPPGTPDLNTGVPGATAAINPMPFLRSHGLNP
jgi:murein DD-endopeptidase MepM/ murein hydrolase activator NlpD